MWFLYDHLQPGSFRPCYADTDSMAIATTESAHISEEMTTEERYRCVFDPIVRPDMKESWEAKWKQWFVTTNTIEDGLTPGKLKCKYWKLLLYLSLSQWSLRSQRVVLLPSVQSAILLKI